MTRDHLPHHGHPARHAPTPAPACGCDGGCAPVIPVSPGAASLQDMTWLSIPAMDCAAEEGEIRRALSELPGLRGLRFRLASRSLGIDAPAESIPKALDAIAGAGFKVTQLAAEPSAPAHGHRHVHDHDHAHGHDHGHPAAAWWRDEVRYGLALALAVVAEALHFLAPDTTAWAVAGMAVAAAAIALAGFSTYAKGLAALRRGRIGISALMTVAVTGAFLIGQWPEAAMVMALYAIAELIEARSVDRARNAIQGLLSLAPETAEVRDADGQWVTSPSSDVQPGQCIRIRPGTRIPLDATIISGQTTVDPSAVTGESMPIERGVGDALFAGTVNLSGTVEATATAASHNTLLARIIAAVEQAQSARAPTQAFVDRFAAIYTPTVFALALAVALLGPWLLDWTWLQGLYKALVLLVIACPCALVISTPVSIVSGLAAAARRGILIKGGVHLEKARLLRTIALDKTGTITEGKPGLVATEVLAPGHHHDEVLHWAADMAGHSDHPVSHAIAAGLDGHGCSHDIDGFEVLPGLGTRARAHGTDLWLGNHRLIESLGVCVPQVEARLDEHESQGRTVTLLASREQVLAIFAVADAIKPSSREAMTQLAAMGVQTHMLSGDNQRTVEAIAREAGISSARGQLMPQDKLDAIRDMQRQAGGNAHTVAMVGDGINDAPALATADLGIAMGGAGTDIAIEAADVVIMNDDLRRIPETMALSRRTHAVLVQNIGLALGIKLVFFVLAVAGSATMWMAVFADMGASLIVVANGLRLLRTRPVRRFSRS